MRNSSRIVRSFVLLIATLGLLLTASAAQVAAPSTAAPKVSLAFFANDDHDKPVSGVTQSELQILDNKKAPARVLGLESRSEIPLLLGMVIDVSGSQQGEEYKAAVQAASEFTRDALSGANDMGFFERFSTAPEATPLMPKSQLLTLKVELNPTGFTALFDAVRFACDVRMKADSVRNYLRVMVLLSDGEDNRSKNDLRQAIASAQRAGVVIFAVDTGQTFRGWRIPGQGPVEGTWILQQLARETGGIAFLNLDLGGVSKAFAAIKEQIDNMYLLSYVPADHAGPQYHSLKINPIPQKRKLKLRAAHGYYSNLIVP